MPRRSAVVPAILLGAAALVGLAGPSTGSTLMISQAMDLMRLIGLSLSMAVIMSYAGYVSFGHSVFIGIGGFSATYVVGEMARDEILGAVAQSGGFLPTGSLILYYIESLLLAGLLSAIVAATIGAAVLRLRGAFFAIATIGLNFAVMNIARFVMRSFENSVGEKVPFPNMGLTTVKLYWLHFAVFLLTVLIAYYVRVSRFGTGLAAIREDEDAAEVMGVDTYRYKLAAFVTAGVLASMWGVADAFRTSFNVAGYFSLSHSVIMILENSIGGIGTFTGPLVGAFIYYPLKWYTQVIAAQLSLLILGALIILVVSFAPRGGSGGGQGEDAQA
ncbi:branched-chain amino acid ABC transporter permease [Aeropyrum camini]|uniref:branched-chain amino acid ABC transporter permease n=1 Tax=Aeropyrum camini TaxID=229980 RepID=UPI000786F575|nr:branched-chain amino acid ABC transporter permease [Aeropyrum camini]